MAADKDGSDSPTDRAPTHQVAQVHVDLPLPHLDRLFDYAVPPPLADQVQAGVRAKVRFAGRLVDAYVMALSEDSDQPRLSPLVRLVGTEVVLPPASRRLLRAVADHCGGSFVDVARLALPPRHATAARAQPVELPPPAPPRWSDGPLPDYQAGAGFLQALAAGGSPRAAWQVAPTAGPAGDWADGLAAAAAATVAAGRRAILVAPDAKDCDLLVAALRRRVDPARVLRQTADLGPAARYRGYLAALAGRAQVVVGSRAAAYLPLPDLGLIGLWDEADDSLVDPRAPYPATRDVVALHASQRGAATLLAAHAPSPEVAAWLERGWLRSISQPPAWLRRQSAQTQIAGQSDRAERSDRLARSARLPHDVFAAIRAGLALGPVLVQVPHRGHRRGLFCRDCGQPLRCGCGGPLAETGWSETAARQSDRPGRGPSGPALACRWCGRPAEDWSCPKCRGRRYRATTTGSARTAAELAQAFPDTTVAHSDGSAPLLSLPDRPALVVATPGAEPRVEAGYAAACLLDGAAWLARPDLTAGPSALRRWLAATSLVRPGSAGGRAILVAPAQDRTAQAWLRLDPAGFASRELADRREARLPPAFRMASVEGQAAAVAEIEAQVAPVDWVERLGPTTDLDDPGQARLLLRCPASRGRDLADLVRGLAQARSAAKTPGAVGWRLDPVDLW
ncbi:MAG: primosome assembly protein PriA [Propionibacteriaceae bacterium]|jgi:primosomal protein N' (replication factor Y)|nr:primosome assembly protein PriA [Propionibacteriaceae bacterium]